MQCGTNFAIKNDQRGNECGVTWWNSPKRKETEMTVLLFHCKHRLLGKLLKLLKMDSIWKGPESTKVIQESKLDFLSLDNHRRDTEKYLTTVLHF